MFPATSSDTCGGELVILQCSQRPEIYVGYSASVKRNKLNLDACCIPCIYIEILALLLRRDCKSTKTWIPISIKDLKIHNLIVIMSPTSPCAVDSLC